MRNKLGICMTGNVPETREENIAALAAAGFETTFFGWDEKTDAAGLFALFEKYGVEVDNLHAPFGGLNCIWQEGSAGDAYLERLKNCAADAGGLGIRYVIVHPTAGAPEPVTTALGLERFRRLIDFAASKGVKVCFENLEYPEVLGVVMDEFSGDGVGFCYDTGHEATCTPGMRFLPLFGDRLCCTHLHDNYGASYSKVPILHGDCHMLPFDAAIDFTRVMRDIRAANYTGALMIEASIRADLGTYGGFTARRYYERAYAAITRLAAM